MPVGIFLVSPGARVTGPGVKKSYPALPEVAGPYRLHRTYRYGRIKLTVFRREGAEEL